MELTHFNESGKAHMVDIGDKEDTKRKAIARGKIWMKRETVRRIRKGGIEKGDVLSVAQIAGIMASKETSRLIPMCHNLFLTGSDIRFEIEDDGIGIEAEVSTEGKTGVEMEALTAVSIAALTIYDMCKAIDKEMEIGSVRLIKKTGGKSGDYMCKENTARVVSVNLSKEKGVVKHPIEEGLFLEDFGLKDDAHSGKWHRQVSLLGMESFEKMKKEGADGLVPGIFAENITTEGLILYELPVGTKILIGETIHEVTQIGKECHSGCEIAKKVGKCVMPEEGIFTRVLKGGSIKIGDKIEVM